MFLKDFKISSNESPPQELQNEHKPNEKCGLKTRFCAFEWICKYPKSDTVEMADIYKKARFYLQNVIIL